MTDPLLYWIGKLNRRTGWYGSRLHVRLYRLLQGRLVGSLRGRPIVLLTTSGRRSGKPRTAPITVRREPAGYLAIASYAPQWQRNLEANPRAVIEDRGHEIAVEATIVHDPQERERFRGFYPALTTIEAIAESENRSVPLIRFTPLRVSDGPRGGG